MSDDGDFKRVSRERFGRFADGYVTSASHAEGDDLARLVELAEPVVGDVALDVATGGGHTALALAPRVSRVVASDMTPEMLDAARGLAERRAIVNVDFALAEAESLPFADAAFDIVACRIAAHHFADTEAFVREACRVLKPGGRLVVEDQEAPLDRPAAEWLNDFERLRDPGHNLQRSALEWRGLFESAGLCVTAVEHFVKEQELRDWVARQGGGDELASRLAALMSDAPPAARAWYRMRDDSGEWRFVIPQVLVSARR